MGNNMSSFGSVSIRDLLVAIKNQLQLIANPSGINQDTGNMNINLKAVDSTVSVQISGTLTSVSQFSGMSVRESVMEGLDVQTFALAIRARIS
jgi:hypothetical protein